MERRCRSGQGFGGMFDTDKPAFWASSDEKGRLMAAITVDDGFCKGCGLCVDACPAHIIELDRSRITAKGYHPARLIDASKCTGCCSCALMCPDVAIEVMR